MFLGVTPQTPTPFNLMKGNSILDFLMLEILTSCIQNLSSVKTRKYHSYMNLIYLFSFFRNLFFLMIIIVSLTIEPINTKNLRKLYQSFQHGKHLSSPEVKI